MDDFDREFQLIFENALIFNEDTSRINKDARILLKLFNTRKKDVYASYKLVQPKSAAIDKACTSLRVTISLFLLLAVC